MSTGSGGTRQYSRSSGLRARASDAVWSPAEVGLWDREQPHPAEPPFCFSSGTRRPSRQPGVSRGDGAPREPPHREARWLPRASDRLDGVGRASARFVEGAPRVLTDDAQGQQLDPGQARRQRGHEQESGAKAWQQEERRSRRRAPPHQQIRRHVPAPADREVGERHDGVDHQLRLAGERPSGPARARAAACRTRRGPGEIPSQVISAKTLTLRSADWQNASITTRIDQEEIGAARGHVRQADEAPHDPVVDGGKGPCCGSPGPLPADGPYDLRAVRATGPASARELRRILEVRPRAAPAASPAAWCSPHVMADVRAASSAPA